jgi:hypothetical protein
VLLSDNVCIRIRESLNNYQCAVRACDDGQAHAVAMDLNRIIQMLTNHSCIIILPKNWTVHHANALIESNSLKDLQIQHMCVFNLNSKEAKEQAGDTTAVGLKVEVSTLDNDSCD